MPVQLGMQLLQQVLALAGGLLDEAFPAAPDLSALSKRLGLGRADLARVYRARKGRTVGASARALRVLRACRLLGEPDCSLAEVALACGFFDQAHFTRAFRKAMHTTPGRYRAACRQR